MRLKEVYIKSGDPYQRGIQHGTQAREYIQRGCGEYHQAFLKKGYTWEDAGKTAALYIPYLEKVNPELMLEARGIAKGAEISLEEVMILNTRYEQLKFPNETEGTENHAGEAECTLYAVEAEATSEKEMIVGQNWDNSPFMGKNLYILHIDEENGTKILALTEPAQLCRSGMNNHGIGLSCATLLSKKDYPGIGIPTNFMRRRLLQCRSLDEAMDCLRQFHPCVSLNYLLGSANDKKAFVAETNPEQHYFVYTSRGVVAHGNDFVVNPLLDRFIPADSYTHRHFRGQRLGYLLMERVGQITPEYVMECLKDHQGYPASVCNHNPTDGLQTIASTVYCLDRGYAYICWGNPCENDYEKYEI